MAGAGSAAVIGFSGVWVGPATSGGIGFAMVAGPGTETCAVIGFVGAGPGTETWAVMGFVGTGAGRPGIEVWAVVIGLVGCG